MLMYMRESERGEGERGRERGRERGQKDKDLEVKKSLKIEQRL